jgi:hypothetical protein
MPRLEQTPARYLHCPRLVAGSNGSATLFLVAWEGEGERVLSVPITPDGTLGAERAGPLLPAIVALSRGDTAEPADASAEREETRGGERVWLEQAGGLASVWLERAGGSQLVFRAPAMVAAPCLAPAPGGTWVAFHTDLREDTGARDVAKWIVLRFVDDAGRVYAPSAPMCERDRDREGTEQSFEFPALVLGEDGALALFGRGSHNFYRQDLSAAGFGPRQALSDGEWGSRGRHVVAAPIAAGLVVARRDRKGIEVDVQTSPTGGAPALTAITVDHAPKVTRAPVQPRSLRQAGGLGVYFGDIQQHSAHSDGVGSADEVYLRARDIYGDDFVALTDHESFLGKRTGPGEWEYLQRVADHYDDAPRFSTFLAYEWTGKMYPGPGHKCVYYPARGLAIVSRDDVPVGRELVTRVHALGGVASPHHIGWTGADEAGHDDLGQPVWEICSCHGCYEHAAHPLGARGELVDQTADVMLKKGHRFGFTASSDSHGLLWHHGEARKRDPYRTGLTALLLPELSRAGALAALKARRCYATSGAKILLDLRVNGAPMGAELGALDALDVSVEALGTAALARIELVGPGGVLASAEPRDEHGALHVLLPAVPYVYARVVQADGEMAWSSPVFTAAR